MNKKNAPRFIFAFLFGVIVSVMPGLYIAKITMGYTWAEVWTLIKPVIILALFSILIIITIIALIFRRG